MYFFVQEKYKIAIDRPGSGNAKNIGSVLKIDDLINGKGPFSRLGEKMFDDYWMFYLTKDMAKAVELKEAPYKNLLEGIIILGEIHLPESQKILTTALLDKQQHPEIRAGAAWALGELRKPDSVDALIQTFTELAEPIRIEAVRALRKISEIETTNIIPRLPSSNEDQRAGIAWAISKSGRFVPDDLLRVMVDDDARRWAAYILGMQDRESFIGKIETLRNYDPEVYFAVTVLWKIIGSWIYNMEEY